MMNFGVIYDPSLEHVIEFEQSGDLIAQGSSEPFPPDPDPAPGKPCTGIRFVTSLIEARGASTARFGVGAAVLPRLEALGWIVDGQPAADYEEMLLAVGRGPDPDGTLHRLATLAEKGVSWRARQGWSWRLSLQPAESLWDSLLRHPEWLDRPGDRRRVIPRLYVQQRICDIALADIHHRWDLETVTMALSDLADETVAFTLDQARSELAGKVSPGSRTSRWR